MKNEATIYDIAKELGISSSTVSRALSNYHGTSEATKRRVREVAERLGYHPNEMASGLRTKRSRAIGVVIPMINRDFFSSAIGGMEEAASKAGFDIVICQSNESPEREMAKARALLSSKVAGVIISLSMHATEFDHLRLFQQKNVPMVLFDRVANEIEAPKVVIDDFAAGFAATQHLLDQGCRRIACLSGFSTCKIYADRLRGYRAALERNGLPWDQQLVFFSELMEEDGAGCARQILALPEQADGLFAGNDTTAITAAHLLAQRGVRVPQDMKVIGFSNEPMSSLFSPSISTISQPAKEMGALSVELLANAIRSGGSVPSSTHILDYQMLVRDSSQLSS